uniref:RING-type domain-containing protein n=1 Tax=Caenorhabditis tropicalis TaxID=1561998 RepID=A0A1I7UN79_9PELO
MTKTIGSMFPLCIVFIYVLAFLYSPVFNIFRIYHGDFQWATINVGTLCAIMAVYYWIWSHNKEETQLKAVRRDWLITYGTFTFFGLLPALVCYLEPRNESTAWYFVYLSLGTISFNWIHFLNPRNEEYRINCPKRSIAPWIVFLFYALILIVAYNYFDHREQKLLVAALVICSPLYIMSSVQIARIYSGNIVKRKVVTVGEKDGHKKSSDCHICTNPFDSGYRIPRILKECGHTVCGECAVKLAEKNKGKHLFCPFCQSVTLVKGPIKECLPQNFSLMEELNERKLAILEV